MRKLPLNILFILLFLSINLQGQDIVKYISEGNIDSARVFFEQNENLNTLYSGYTPIELCIQFNQKEILQVLIEKNAQLDLPHKGWTPLLYSIHFEQVHHSNDIINLFIESGANLNLKGIRGMTPLIYACYMNNSEIAIQLYDKGADSKIKDYSGKDFFYYVLQGNNTQLIQHFLSMGYEIPRIKSISEGPHVKWIDNENYEVSFFRYDSLTDQVQIESELYNKGNGQASPVRINQAPSKISQKVNYKGVSKIFAVSDIHGQYDHLIGLLKSNDIIDDDLNWKFGDGHLVIVGDIFDRGDKVTECLWLIYKLEQQAPENRGMVHYLLGNHELMVIKDNNKRYVNNIYTTLCAKHKIDYYDLFSSEYELGRWLRTKNVALKINDILFVHGGLPPEFSEMKRTLVNMNKSFRNYLTSDDSESYESSDKRLIVQPVWYRDYFNEEDISADVKRMLKYYKAKKIVVGHTTIENIGLFQGDNVIGIGIHFGIDGKIAEGLMFENKQFMVRDESGNEIELK